MDISITPFNQGETYRTRRDASLEKLRDAEHNGLKLYTVLYESVCSCVSEDVGKPVSGPRFLFRFVKGIPGYLLHNKLFGDLGRKATLGIGLHSCSSADDQIWVLITDSRRAVVESQLKSIVKDSPYVSLELDMSQRLKGLQYLRRVVQYIKLFRKCFQRFSSSPFGLNHSLAMGAIWASDVADQARELFSRQKPRALFMYQDFTGISNALIQVARDHDIPTYSTSHAIHPEFTGKNERLGNAVFENSFSDVYVCWGKHADWQMSKYLEKTRRQRRLLLHSRPTSPAEKQFDMDKSSREKINTNELIVSLMGRRHEADNGALLHLVTEFVKNKPYHVTVRPHPTLRREKYQAYLDYIKEKYFIEAELSDSRTSVQSNYTDRSLGITGLTSTYYENLFFGIPVVFFDFAIELVEELPRVLPAVTSPEDLAQQVDLIESLTWHDWYQKADPVCEAVYNRSCLDFEDRESMIELVREDAGQRTAAERTRSG